MAATAIPRSETRPDYDWPEGKRLAFYIGLNVEHFAFMTGRGAASVSVAEDPLRTQREFRLAGLRPSCWHLVRFPECRRTEIAGDASLLTVLLLNYRGVIERMKQRGDDICVHWAEQWETIAARWEHDQTTPIAETTETITRHSGTRPLGWMGPAAAESRVMPDLLVEAGDTQSPGWPVDDQPNCNVDLIGTAPERALSDGAERYRHYR